MNFSYLQKDKNIFINNIFKIRKNIFDIANFNENDQTVNFNENNKSKKVIFSNVNECILIPCRKEIIDNNLKYNIWYSIDELKLMRTSFMYELNIITQLNNITLSEANNYWKKNNSLDIDNYSS